MPSAVTAVADTRAQIDWLAIPTCGRPHQLARAVRSYVGNARLFGRQPALLIADDSPTGSAWPLCVQVLRRTAARAGIRLSYQGRVQRSRFAAALTERGDLPPDVARFALCGDAAGGETIGANRNGILLSTLGSLVLSVDDDTIGRTATAPDTVGQDLIVTDSGGPGTIRIFSDRAAALRYVRSANVDILAEHESLLGRDVPGHGRILVTLNGLAGDCGAFDNMWVRISLTRSSPTGIDSAEAYRLALASREIVRQVTRPTISPLRPWLSTFFGVDNRTLLPPFFPAYRNDESIFGALLSECLEHHCAGHLPWTLVHAPAQRRVYASRSLASIRMSDIVLLCLSSWHGRRAERSAAEILHAVGQHLIDMASRPQPEFDDLVGGLLRRRASVIIGGLDRLGRSLRAERRDYWANDLTAQAASFTRAVERPGYGLPVDLLATGAPDVPARTRALVGQFGVLLTWWPAIVQRTRALAHAGRRFDVPVS